MKYYSAHFSYLSGANPYISFSEHNTRVILARCRKRGWTVTESGKGFYIIDDREARPDV